MHRFQHRNTRNVKKGNMTLLKVHNFLVTESKDLEVDKNAGEIIQKINLKTVPVTSKRILINS